MSSPPRSNLSPKIDKYKTPITTPSSPRSLDLRRKYSLKNKKMREHKRLSPEERNKNTYDDLNINLNFLKINKTPIDVENNSEENKAIVPGCVCCGLEIEEGNPFIIDRDGYNYHPECFRCIKCDHHINGDQYKPTKDGPICLDCGLPQCAGCMNLIVGDMIVCKFIDDTKYAFHTQCLKCVNCNHNITNKYRATKFGFICENCDSPKCSSCSSMIPGGSQYYLDKDTNQPQCNNCYRNRVLSKTNNVHYNPGTNTTTIHLTPTHC